MIEKQRPTDRGGLLSDYLKTLRSQNSPADELEPSTVGLSMVELSMVELSMVLDARHGQDIGSFQRLLAVKWKEAFLYLTSARTRDCLTLQIKVEFTSQSLCIVPALLVSLNITRSCHFKLLVTSLAPSEAYSYSSSSCLSQPTFNIPPCYNND